MRQMKDSRRAEDLILGFVTAASKTLRKDQDVAEQWRSELDVQTGQFIEILSDALKACGPGYAELQQKLHTYRTDLFQPSVASSSTKHTKAKLEWVFDELLKLTPSVRASHIKELESACSVKVSLLRTSLYL
jgi:hypothetical protein